ncbi:PREDICTED: 11-beta-hydroxysteroid dehydrogenase-like 4A isoform X3 [Tarenaya hassleriana]|uniref:11-beta-hydroxysteroid dehydrogenase-like 4A isoform X3 n=1 Tax=Tarenaya hassleriana TaxID=28532 RepID=UPI00053C85CD|nr:PREDICTED: 11-beta-hydroxysteroid dehydrogenase-like 4A isoform X3 [Tarenaya hassleriana]
MDMVNKTLSIVLPTLVLLSLFLLSPLLSLFKLFNCVRRRLNTEDVTGNVVLITGASSGIGEQLAYEYARRGALLMLVDLREDRLPPVAEKCRRIGSPDVVSVGGDVTVVEDCERFVDETINHFGRLDHLVNNAGIIEFRAFEDHSQLTNAVRQMDTNFWGSVFATHFAIPHLKRSKGKIVVMASASGWFSYPKLSIYGATKAAMINFYETLRIELGPEIGVTIIGPGFTKTEMATPEILAKEGWGFMPVLSATTCAKSIVDGVCRKERFVTKPSWIGSFFWVKTLCPELTDWFCRFRMKPNSKHD